MDVILGVVLLSAALGFVESRNEGCYTEDGQFYNHRQTWANSTYPSCINYRCMDGNVITNYKGCISKGKCRRVGAKWAVGCTDYRCTRFKEDSVTYFEVTPKQKCEYKGKCYRNRQRTRDGCDRLTCKVIASPSGSIAFMDREGRCPYKKRCYDDGAEWTKGCANYTCTVTKSRGKVRKQVKGVAACRFKGQCYIKGAEWDYQCTTYRCEENGKNSVIPVVIAAACPWNGDCYEEGTSWEDDSKCLKYVCEKQYKKQKRFACQVKKYKKGCIMGGSCRPFGYTRKDSRCITWQCKKSGSRGSRVARVRGGCKDFEGKCRDYGERYTRSEEGVTQNCRCKRRSAIQGNTVCEVVYDKKK